MASKDQVLSAPIYSLGFASLQKGESFRPGFIYEVRYLFAFELIILFLNLL